MNMFYHRNIRNWKDYQVYDHEKVKFRYFVACYWLLIELLKAPLPLNKTKQL